MAISTLDVNPVNTRDNAWLDLLVASSIPNAYKRSASEIMALCGLNIGNLVFRHAMFSLVENAYDYRCISYEQIDGLSDLSNHVIVSCANWLSASKQRENRNAYRVKQLKKINCPVISFGLGAQASSGAKIHSLELGSHTRELACLLADKCNQLSVRDEFTYDVVKRLGIENAVVTGCPSNFLNLDTDLGAVILAKSSSLLSNGYTWSMTKAHLSECSSGHPAAKDVLRNVIKLLSASPSFYIIQDPLLLPYLLREVNIIANPYRLNVTEIEDFSRIIRAKALHFSSVDAWLDFSRTCDLALGMRLHGNMVPLQAGVPSLVIGHDSRTEGLANFMGVPVMSPEKFIALSGRSSPADIVEFIANTMSGYDLRRKKLASTWVDFMLSNSILPNLQLRKFNS